MIIQKKINNKEKTMVTENKLKFKNLTPTGSFDKIDL